MATYPQLARLIAGATAANGELLFNTRAIPYLVAVWLNDYERGVTHSAIVETSVRTFSYLFDVDAERLIAAWGMSGVFDPGQRDSARMASHPMSKGPHYHRGHAIPHSLGSPTDINLVAQRASVNVGPFRILERRAVATPGSLYFTYWGYDPKSGQHPSKVDQGLLIPGQLPDIRTFAN